MNYLKRCFNVLNEQNINSKKSTAVEVYNFIQSNKHEFDSSMFSFQLDVNPKVFIEQIMNQFVKNILKAMADNAEKVREYSTKLLNL